MFKGLNTPPLWLTDYIGTEFQDAGRGELCDCWGLVRRVFKEVYLIDLPRYDGYESTEELDKLASLLEEGRLDNEWHEIERGKEFEGDVVLFKMKGQLCHVGLCLHGGLMLHIQKGKNGCIEDYEGIRWSKRVHSFYRHEKML
jgi:cell wall-associated NlpC family hydrolase